MARLLVSKKGIMPKALLLAGILCVAFCFYSFASGMTERRFMDSDMDEYLKVLAPVLLGIAGMISLVSAFAFGKTSVMVYDDHIEGVGVGKTALAPHTFHFAKNLNYTVQVSNATLKVSCGSESYSVSLTKADAQEVYHVIYGGGTSRGPAPQRPATGTTHAANTTTPPKTGTTTNTSTPPKTRTTPNTNAGTKTGTASNVNTPPKTGTATSANAATQTKIAVCPHCSAKCRVPAGKGLIRISCPNPACKVPFTFDS